MEKQDKILRIFFNNAQVYNNKNKNILSIRMKDIVDFFQNSIIIRLLADFSTNGL